MSSVYIDSKYRPLVELLAVNPVSQTRKAVFDTNMDLYVFAAMVGSQDISSDSYEFTKGNEIPDSVFRNNNFDGLIYLLALTDRKNADILRENSEPECWAISERYAFAGFEEINNWFL